MTARASPSQGPTTPETCPPDALFSGRPGDPLQRLQYEAAYSPIITDALNRGSLVFQRQVSNPLGDIVPFSAYLIGRILSPEGYPVDFNLDADRGFGYLCWDWTRAPGSTATNGRGQTYVQPKVPPEGANRDGGANAWAGAWRDAAGAWKQVALQLQYIDRSPPRFAQQQDQHREQIRDHGQGLGDGHAEGDNR